MKSDLSRNREEHCWGGDSCAWNSGEYLWNIFSARARRTCQGLRLSAPSGSHGPEAFRKVLVILLLLYDALLIPYMLGFDIDFDGWIAKQLFFTASFWTLDVCFSLVQGRPVLQLSGPAEHTQPIHNVVPL